MSAVVLASALFAPAITFANDAHHGQSAIQKIAAAEMAEGEVRKINKEAGKLTIKHGPIQNLGMPGMTMIFRVSDPAMLEQAKVGDKIRFEAQKINGALTVTALNVIR